MKKHIAILCMSLLAFSSCSDFLDVQPEGDAPTDNYFLNDQQAIDAIDALYAHLQQEGCYGRELFWEQGAANDIVWGRGTRSSASTSSWPARITSSRSSWKRRLRPP